MKFFNNKAKRKCTAGAAPGATKQRAFFCVSDVDLPGRPGRTLRSATPLRVGMVRNLEQRSVDISDTGIQQSEDDAALIQRIVPDGDRILLKLAQGKQTLAETDVLVGALGRLEVDLGGGLSLLHLAALNNRHHVVRYLLARGHPTELKTAHGETPLDQAAWRGHLDAAKHLIRGGADIDCCTLLGYTPLHRCGHYGHFELTKVLLTAGANQHLRDTENNQTARECALLAGRLHIADLFSS